MKKLLALLLALVIAAHCMFVLTACSPDGTDDPGNTEITDPPSDEPKIIVPDYKDYGRGTINFSQIVYERPDISSAIYSFNKVAEIIKANKTSYHSQLQEIYSLEPSYLNIETMYSFVNIYAYKNSADSFFSTEYQYLCTNYPLFAQAVENLFVAAANSPHNTSFESDYFGNGLIETYSDGGIYTENAVILFSKEAELEAEYSNLSTATVEITYEDTTDTMDNILKNYLDEYGESSKKYLAALVQCEMLYNERVEELSSEILVELFKVRRLIADELGYSTYTEFAYGEQGYDYSSHQLKIFANSISEYILPVYSKLSYVFSCSDASYTPTQISRIDLINSAYEALLKKDTGLAEIYAYMLQHTLYDVELNEANRFEGAFTTYLPKYEAPFLFATTSGDAYDYTTLFHEFGHFADFYKNFGAQSALDVSEISSQALELLSVSILEEVLSEEEIEHLTYYLLENALTTLIYQGFYALFEHYAYDIEYDEISLETLNEAVKSAAKSIGLSYNQLNDVRYVMIPHIFMYPCYVQSYCTSVTVALQIFFKEAEDAGSGFEVYQNLIEKDGAFITFNDCIEMHSFNSPFINYTIKELANKIHFYILGSNFFTSESENEAA